MTRWDYDTVFYRVFCTALLGVALTFTVILTNVFIDIDGLLYKKNKANTDKLEKIQAEVEDVVTSNFVPDGDMYDYKDYDDSYTAERTKRSLETQDFSYHIKDPKMKKEITNRLTALLEDLDKKGSSKLIHKEKQLGKYTKNVNKNSQYNNEDVTKSYKSDIEYIDSSKKSLEDLDDNIEIFEGIERIKKEKENKLKLLHKENELKHLAMHNIILQGIIGHMDLGDVYARVHSLIHNLETSVVKDNLKGTSTYLQPEQEQFLNELINCKQLKDQIVAETAKPETRKTLIENKIRKPTLKPIGRNVMIKTIIDITSLVNDKTDQDNESKENVNGIIKLIYNGKTLKFRRVDESTTTLKPKGKSEKLISNFRTDSNVENIKETEDKILSDVKNPNQDIYVPNVYMKNIISDYLKKVSRETERLDNAKMFTTKRLKRHVEIVYDNEETKTTVEPPKLNDKKGDDELYVEIETHFDSKGLKGEKKKKMIRDLVEKIQKAIHSEKEVKKKKHKHLHVKKRNQNPLDNENIATFISDQYGPLNSLGHRELDPISKSMPLHETLPYISDNRNNWKMINNGPRFLTVSKAINSAEMSEVDTDYNKIMDNGIPQRLQIPLNTDNIGQTSIFNTMQNQGNSNIMVKNIAGSGFSIGFNQYVDESPDAESMKLFTGIENIIQTYHQKYDEDTNADSTNAVNAENTNQENFSYQRYPTNLEQPTNQEYPPPETNDHLIVRRSIKKMKRDYHSNEYKVIFNKNFLNYDNYQDIYNSKDYSKIKFSNNTKKNINSALVDNIFSKDLKPAEIFNLADLLERQKRSLSVKKISNINIKNKKKLNRYLNTKSMASKKIFQKNKRIKRQINKIRIIAKDLSKNHKHTSEEDIFVMSDEKVFADRAILKEVETPGVEPSEKTNEEHYDIIASQKPVEEHFDIIAPQKVSEDHYDIISPQKEADNHYDIISPYIFDAPSMETSYTNNMFTKRSRHNSLMSRYPHLFMEEITRSKEDFTSDNPYMYGNHYPVKVTTQIVPTIVEIPQFIPESKFNNPVSQEIVDHYPTKDKSNYKVTVKIMPKNSTGLNSGFKEIHTSINKSYNKNGLVYTSLVNVSEISKVEKINKTKESHEIANPSEDKLKREQLRIKSIIQQHKDRIEEQLEHLKKEKEKLDRIDIRNTEFSKNAPKEYLDIAVATNPARTLHIAKEDLGKLFEFEENNRIPTLTEQTSTTTTTDKPSTTTLTTTTEFIKPTTEDLEKVKIINTIQRNEKMTNEILNKIDKNTDILQIFLNKLISKIEAPHIETTRKPEDYPKTTEATKKLEENPNNYEEQTNKPKSLEPKFNEMYEQSIPNAFFNLKDVYTNGSGIPFVYAFQRPYTIPNNDGKEMPIASVVYQGHIHAHTINQRPEKSRIWKEKRGKNKKQWTPNNTKPDIKEIMLEGKNVTKFFIDDLENDYKVLPIEGKTVYPGNMNGTKT